MSPRPFTYRLSDDREWGYCVDCGECFPPEQPHACDQLRAAKGIALGVVIALIAYALVAVGLVAWLFP